MDTKNLRALKDLHDDMGKCLSGYCNHNGIGKCLSKIGSAHSAMGTIIDHEPGLGDTTENEKYAAIDANDPGVIQKTFQAIYSSDPVLVE